MADKQRQADELHVIILAAGQGTRMRTTLPKVLQPLAGKPMIRHLLETVQQLSPKQIHLVHGHGSEQLQAALSDVQLNWVLQDQQRGTGHAVSQAMPAIPAQACVLVLMADHPLVPLALLETMLDNSSATVLVTMELSAPHGYGRILRDRQGRFAAIIEQADASIEQQQIVEVNSGIYLFPAAALRRWLTRLNSDNAAAENYLTDVLAMAVADGMAVSTLQWPQADCLQGANTQAQLAQLERLYQQQLVQHLLQAGVRIADPQRLDIRGQVDAGLDVFIDVNVVLSGHCQLGDKVSIGPGCVLHDCQLGSGTQVLAYSVLQDVRCGERCMIGPFAHCRPGTRLANEVKIGNFVETKNAVIGAHSKASHLSYLGDAQLGERVNIGAGTITCNFDGVSKWITRIADDVFIGSDTQLIAPVSIGAGAFIGAGSTISHDAPAGQLTLSRSKQTTLQDWRAPAQRVSSTDQPTAESNAATASAGARRKVEPDNKEQN
jgi:bifunctional UDP-N-acetylglucosamine pyrophosphorylase/glucosamine-1-phosphate N-acetyltransferase